MSWEGISTKPYKCPCGKGHYTISVLADDWNRSEEKWSMECKKCKTEYALFTYSFSDSGIMTDNYVWVEKQLFEKVTEIENELNNNKAKVLKTAQSKYLNAWVAFFKDAKSKKEVWRKLTDNGKNYPSYTTMISQLKRTDLKAYLNQKFYFANLNPILKSLNIKDAELEKALSSINELESNLIHFRKKLVSEGYT